MYSLSDMTDKPDTQKSGSDSLPEDRDEAESREEEKADEAAENVKDTAGAEAGSEDTGAGRGRATDSDESTPSKEKAETEKEAAAQDEDGDASQSPAAAEPAGAAGSEEPAKPGKAEAGPDIEELKQNYEAQLRVYKEKMYRIAADFENHKKRTQREFGEREDRAKAEVIKVILPTIDNIKRAVEHSSQAQDIKSVVDGLKLIEKSFLDTLAKTGITRLDTEGQVFDPTYHEAIAQTPSPDVPAGTILKEIQPGYMLNEKLLRAPLVVVSSGAPEGAEAPKEPEEEAAEPAAVAREPDAPQQPEFDDDDIKDPEEVCVEEPARVSSAEPGSSEVICSRIISLEESAEAGEPEQKEDEEKPEEAQKPQVKPKPKPKPKLTAEEKSELKEKLKALEEEKKKGKEKEKEKKKGKSRKKTTSRKKSQKS